MTLNNTNNNGSFSHTQIIDIERFTPPETTHLTAPFGVKSLQAKAFEVLAQPTAKTHVTNL